MLLDRVPVRLRLAIAHGIWMSLVLVGVGSGVYRIVENQMHQSVDAALLTSAQSIRDARFVKGFSSPLLQSFLQEFLSDKFIRAYAQLVDFSGRVSAKTSNVRVSLPVSPAAVARAEQGLHTFETISKSGRATLRQVTLPVFHRGKFTGELIQVGASLESTTMTLRGISLMLWIALPAAMVLSVLFGYLLTARSLRPVTVISRAASKLGADDLSLRLKLPRANDELRVLTQTFNDMLDRLEDAFMRLRRFAGDVSHELRTPLAVARAEAELALRKERTPEEYRAALKVVSQEANNMTMVVEDLLLLARAQGNAVAMNWEVVDASSFAHDLVAMVKPVYDSKSVALKVTNAAERLFQASPSYLALALKNILLNACKHSASGSNVELKIAQDAANTYFTIQDHGEGIPAESLPYIFDAFYRADTARNRAAGGSGIGLSLAQALVKLHRGQIAADSKVGEGATFMITIPQPEPEDQAAKKKRLLTRGLAGLPTTQAPQTT